MVGVNKDTIAGDLGLRKSGENSPFEALKQKDFGEFSPPAIPPDDFDAIKQERKERRKEEKIEERRQLISRQRDDIANGKAELPIGKYDICKVLTIGIKNAIIY